MQWECVAVVACTLTSPWWLQRVILVAPGPRTRSPPSLQRAVRALAVRIHADPHPIFPLYCQLP